MEDMADMGRGEVCEGLGESTVSVAGVAADDGTLDFLDLEFWPETHDFRADGGMQPGQNYSWWGAEHSQLEQQNGQQGGDVGAQPVQGQALLPSLQDHQPQQAAQGGLNGNFLSDLNTVPPPPCTARGCDIMLRVGDAMLGSKPAAYKPA